MKGIVLRMRSKDRTALHPLQSNTTCSGISGEGKQQPLDSTAGDDQQTRQRSEKNSPSLHGKIKREPK